MSMPTPTPTPVPRPLDEVTQPSVAVNLVDPDDASANRLDLSPTQWETEALAAADEAEARGTAVPAAGALRYAAARMLSDRVGDSAAAIEHLQLAIADPPGATFAPVLRALRMHAIDIGSFWSA